MRVGVEDPTQHMSAASQTVRDPAGPYPYRAHSVCQTGSMGAATQTESKSRKGRHVTCPRQCFCLPLPQAQALFANHQKFRREPPGGVYDDWNRRIQGRRCSRSPQQPREPPWREHPRILGPCLNNCMHSVERHSTTPMLLSSWRIRWVRFPRAALPYLTCIAWLHLENICI
jgi:hypothetical protein